MTLSDAIPIGGSNEFLKELDRALSRVKQFNHRVTVLLIELEEAKKTPEEAKKIADSLRDSDTIYQIEKGLFAAILQGTHEAGGEAAALRIKRVLSQNREEDQPKVYIGVMSIDPKTPYLDADIVFSILKKDLLMDKEWHKATPKDEGVEPSKDAGIGHVVIFTQELRRSDDLSQELRRQGYKIFYPDTPEEGLDYLKGLDKAVVILEGSLSQNLKEYICENIHINRELDVIFKIYIEEGDPPSGKCRGLFDEILPVDIDRELLKRFVITGMETSRLRVLNRRNMRLEGIISSVKTTIHRLNQPLQVILGKAELVLVELAGNLKNIHDVKQIVQDIEQIKNQAQKAAEITRKTERLLSAEE